MLIDSLRVLVRVLACAALACTAVVPAYSSDPPRIVQKDGRFAFLLDGKPYLILGGQMHNSSGWPSELDQVWKAMEALHGNTVEAPVYWEQFESQPGKFDFSNVDALVEGARAHNLHLIVLWFGTWKNGNMHYVPAWVKQDGKRFPRVIRADGEPIDVLSPISRNTLDADKSAFTALTRHLKETDGDRHTVIMIQVENESGNVGSVRDFSAEANRLFEGPVPAELLTLTGKQPGTWEHVFGGGADEMFQVYYQARYINEIAAAGKRELNIPFYANVWLTYPMAQLAQRQVPQPGIGYPSGGPVQRFVGLWRKLAPAIDLIGPDIYSDDPAFVLDAMKTYRRPDNALWIPETGRSDNFAKFFFKALEYGAIGFSPFGVDESGWNITGDEAWRAHARNFAAIEPLNREIAQLVFDGKVKTAVEMPGEATEEIDLGEWQATVAYGFPQHDGEHAPGTKDAHGSALVARLGPDEFLVMGVDSSVTFHLPGKLPWMRSDFLTVEEGSFQNGAWKATRLLNGDETDRGLQFHGKPTVIRVKMERF